jgi:hypothetical protein
VLLENWPTWEIDDHFAFSIDRSNLPTAFNAGGWWFGDATIAVRTEVMDKIALRRLKETANFTRRDPLGIVLANEAFLLNEALPDTGKELGWL